MSQADDIGNLFHRFGASADSYKEINTEFEYLEPLPASVEPADILVRVRCDRAGDLDGARLLLRAGTEGAGLT